MKDGAISDIVRGGYATCGFRIPNNKEALNVLSEVGPLVVTSANRSGQKSALTADEVEACFGQDFPVLESSEPSLNLESTVLGYIKGEWQILRQGAVVV